MPIRVCNNCGKKFTRKSNYDYHVNKRKRPCVGAGIILKSPPQIAENCLKLFGCRLCNKSYTRSDNLKRHLTSVHSVEVTDSNEEEFCTVLVQTHGGNEEHPNHSPQSSETAFLQNNIEQKVTNADNHENLLKIAENDLKLLNLSLKTDCTSTGAAGASTKNPFWCNFGANSANKSCTNHENIQQVPISGDINPVQNIAEIAENSSSESQKVNVTPTSSDENCLKTVKHVQKENDAVNSANYSTSFAPVYQCHTCWQIFTRKSSLIRHSNGRCKGVPSYKNHKSSDELVNIHDTTLTKRIIETSNNLYTGPTANTTINNNNNIQVMSFGKEDLYQIVDDETCKKILKKGFNAVIGLIEHVYFNEDMPECHNVYIPNKREKFVKIKTNKVRYDPWELRDQQEAIESMINEAHAFLAHKFEEFNDKGEDELDDITKKKFGRYMDDYDEDTVQKNMQNDVKMILYNYRKIPINTKKRLLENKPK